MPLVADLAPPGLRGRYLAALGLSWWIGLVVGPVLGAPLLARAPTAAFSATVAVATVASALALGPRLPHAT
jgi:hypothetical protein